MNGIINKLFLGLLCLTTGLLFGMHAYLGGFTRLMADDFCSVYFARRLDVLRFIWYWYLNWGGRYSAIAVDSLIESIDSDGLRFVPLIVIMLWTTITALALHQLLKKGVGENQTPLSSLALGGVTLATILTVTPMPEQVLYWWNGMRTYVPALISFTFHLGFLYWATANPKVRPGLFTLGLFSFILAFISGGFNETFTPVQLLFFAGMVALGVLTKRLRFNDPFFILLGAATISSALSLLIMLTSPGTTNRLGATDFPVLNSLATTLAVALTGYRDFLASMLASPGKISALAGMILLSIWISMESSRTEPGTGRIPLVILCSGIVLAFVSLLPSAYIYSEMPAPRTFVVPSFIFVTGLMATGLASGQYWASRAGISNLQNIRTGLITISTILIIISTSMTMTMMYENKDTYIHFAEQWDVSDSQIMQAKTNGDDSVQIAAPGNWAGLNEPNDNPRFWVNRCYTLYYGIQVYGPSPDTQPP